MIFKSGDYEDYDGEIRLHLDLPSVLIAVVKELAEMSKRSNTDYFTIRDAFSAQGFNFKERRRGDYKR